MAGPLLADEMTYDDLVRLIRAERVTSVEALLPRLPESFRAGYALLYRSRSLQKASHESPRAILFGRRAKLTCAFDGDGDSLECFQFVDATRSFDFRHIRFPTAANGLAEVAFSQSNQTVDGKIACSSCHAADPRPNWDHYSLWEGAYGRDDDELVDELAPYARFVGRRAAHPRYRWLVQDDYAKAPYLDLAAGRIALRHRPNLRFSEAATRLNALRAQRILESRVRRWETLGFALRALQCPLTEEQRRRIEKAGLSFEKDADLAGIFGKLGVTGAAWSTQIFSDPLSEPKHPWEHQAGFAYLSFDVAMAVVQSEARAGDVVLRDGLDAIRSYYERRYQGEELELRRAWNETVVDPDTFGGHLTENLAQICPRLAEVFVHEYLGLP